MDAEELKQKAKQPKNIGFASLTLVMLVVFLISLGTQVPQLWPLSTQLEAPTSLSVFEDSIAVIDQQYSRFTQIGEDGQVESTYAIDFWDRAKEQYTTAFVVENGTYYAVSNYFSDSAYIESEKVYYRGNHSLSEVLIFERTYTQDQKVSAPLFCTMTSSSDGSDTLLLARTPQKDTVEAISLISRTGEVVSRHAVPSDACKMAQFSYGDSSGLLAATTYSGKLLLQNEEGVLEELEFDGFHYFSHCAWDNMGRLFCIDSLNRSLVCIDPGSKTILTKTSGNSYYSLDAGRNGELIVCGTADGFDVYKAASYPTSAGEAPEPVYSQSASIPYSPSLAARSVIIWLSIVYLAACVLFVIVRLVRKLLQSGQGGKVRRACTIASVIVLIVAVSVFHTVQFYAFAEKSYMNSLEGICQDIANNITDVVDSDAATLLHNKGEASRKKATETLGALLASKSAVYTDSNIPFQAFAFFESDEVQLLLFANTEGYTLQSTVPGGASLNTESALQLAQQAGTTVVVSTEDLASSRYFTAYRFISSSDGKVVGMVKFYSSASSLLTSYRSLCFDMVMTMLAVGGALVIVLLESKHSVRARARLRQEREKEDGHPEIWTTRRLNFWGCLVSGFDSSMSVLVASEMLTALGYSYSSALAGLPAALGSLGLFLGSIAYYFLLPRVSARALSTVGATGACILFAFAAFAVWNNAFWLYCAFRFGASLFLSIPVAIVYVIPERATDDTDKKQLFDDCKVSSISGAALGCLICGYVAQYLGNAWIYCACMVPVLVILMLCLRHMPKKVTFGYQADSADQIGSESGIADAGSNGSQPAGAPAKNSLLRLFTSPAIIALLACIVIPSMLFNGYKSILFPLFMSDVGLSKANINTIIALSNVMIFLAVPTLMQVKRGFNRWTVQLCVMLFAAGVLAWFTVNSTPAWAILALFLLGAAYRLCSRRSFIVRESARMEVSSIRANNAYSVLQQLLSAFRSPLLSALAGLGQTVACLILSGICIVGASVFAFVTRNSSWRGKVPDASASASSSSDGAQEADADLASS